jgi:hypothetical protein
VPGPETLHVPREWTVLSKVSRVIMEARVAVGRLGG